MIIDVCEAVFYMLFSLEHFVSVRMSCSYVAGAEYFVQLHLRHTNLNGNIF